MLSKGIYIRKVNHYILNGPYTGKVVLDVKQRKWKLPHCDIYYNINCFPVQNFAERKKKKKEFPPSSLPGNALDSPFGYFCHCSA